MNREERSQKKRGKAEGHRGVLYPCVLSFLSYKKSFFVTDILLRICEPVAPPPPPHEASEFVQDPGLSELGALECSDNHESRVPTCDGSDKI